VVDRQLEDAQSGAGGAHLHLQIPAIGRLAHAERSNASRRMAEGPMSV